MTQEQKKQVAWIDRHEPVIQKYCKRLAMDFETPAKWIVAEACQELRITTKQWNAMMGVRIARDNGELQ